MKKLVSILSFFALIFTISYCTTDDIISDAEIIHSEKKSDLNTNNGFDQWGYNWNAHQFNGYLINAWFGDEMDPTADWYKKEPPYNGDWEGYAEDHPEVLEYGFYYYGNMTMVSHWNESCISKEGVYNDQILDSDAWITFHYRAGEGKEKWSQFQKFVAAKSSYTLEIYLVDDYGQPVYGEWFSEDDESVGLYYLWPDRVLIQVVNTGSVPEGMLPTYKGIIGPGLGK